MNKILSSTKFVVDNSVDVSIDNDTIKSFCKNKPLIQKSTWFTNASLSLEKLKEKEQIHFIFLVAALGFCFWGSPKWNIKYQEKRYDGFWGLIASLARAIENGHDLVDFVNIIGISREELSFIFAGSGDIPLFEERLQILRDISSVTVNIYSNDFRNLIRDSEIDVLKFQKELIQHYPSFDDSSTYKSEKIVYNKRAQLLIIMLYQLFNGTKFGDFFNMEELTALADYKVPNVLRCRGIIKYSKNLSKIIDNKNIIERDSDYENEIRSNTIWAVELIKDELQKNGVELNSSDIGDYLWLLGKTKYDYPYHRTTTTAY